MKEVARSKARKTHELLPRIGNDEKAFLDGENYVTLIYALDRITVEAMSDGNDTESGNACFRQLSSQQRESVEAIAMDMSAFLVKRAKQNVPPAETRIVHDRSHVVKLASDSVDEACRVEHRQLKRDGDDRLTGTRYLRQAN
ncbi:transposase [Rhodopirellula bahusiensis]|uniref:transposase n=1 Tax=Rhodopirellula bahusiensis TaxID=2014065 RepID=UPI0032645197